MGVTLPAYQDCNKCGAELACRFEAYGYNQPCIDCKSTPEYEKENGKPKERSMQDIIDTNKPASVFEGGGRVYTVNKHGNIIKDEPYRPLPVGKKDWR